MFLNKSLFVILIAFCSLTNASSSLMNIKDNKLNGSEIQSRAVFCQNLFGIDG
jgi:hypothetical protein